MKPKRIQLSRKKGWRKPPNTVVVARPSIWGNPWPVGKLFPPAKAVERYRKWVDGNVWTFPNKQAIQETLRGKNLACWCPIYDKKGLRVPCHADILLSLANDIPMEEICRPLTIQNSQNENATPVSG